MKVLIVGNGGREHALAWRLSRSPSVSEVIASPGNPGMAQLGSCFPAPDHVLGFADLAESRSVDVTVVGPEAPLTQGIVDVFRSRNLQIVGPTQAAAQLEGSKIFAKEFFDRAGIPTARFSNVHNFNEARKALASFSYPVVVKADGLAAGKGVIIAATESEAFQAIEQLGPHLVLEEFLHGEEVSFIGLSDGHRILPFAPSQDHKRAYDGDQGPNTGGMGAICDTRILTDQQSGVIMDRIMLPALHQMTKLGMPFTGFLYAGLMLTERGPQVLEFNVRLGDPETQAILYGMNGDLGEILRASLDPTSSVTAPSWPEPSACVVIAAAGYPDQPRTGDPISGIEAAEASGVKVFQAGTQRKGDQLLTRGGRVLGITSAGATLPEAIQAAYRGVGAISFRGGFYRKDIGQRGLARC